MNLDPIEVLLVGELKKLIRKQAHVLAGPVFTPALGGMQETIFVHAARFEDHHGVTADGASIARRPIRNGRVAGIAEERPCHIVVEVTCIATTYSRIKALSEGITPEILLVLACEREFELGASANNQSSVKFTDFQASLNQAETIRREDDDLVFHLERLVFHIKGALHVQLAKYGGLKAKKSVLKKPARKARKKAVAKSTKKPKKVSRK